MYQHIDKLTLKLDFTKTTNSKVLFALLLFILPLFPVNLSAKTMTWPILKMKRKGGQNNGDGTVTYYSVKQRLHEPILPNGRTGHIVKCTGAGPEACVILENTSGIIPPDPNTNDPGVDLIDLANANYLISYGDGQINNGQLNGTYTWSVMDPSGTYLRIYTLTWYQVIGDEETDYEMLITKEVVELPIQN